VGAATEIELKEKKHRIEDALSATRAAIEEGIVAGGGTALVRSRAAVNKAIAALTGDEATGAAIVGRALAEPLKWIAINAGFEGAVMVREVEHAKGTIGLTLSGELEDLVKPASLTRRRSPARRCRTPRRSLRSCSRPRRSSPTSRRSLRATLLR